MKDQEYRELRTAMFVWCAIGWSSVLLALLTLATLSVLVGGGSQEDWIGLCLLAVIVWGTLSWPLVVTVRCELAKRRRK
jgi:hypothetical protein